MKRFPFSVCLLAAAILPLASCGTEDPGRLTVEDQPACSTCSVELEHVVRLGSASDPASYALFATVSRDRQGRYYVVPARGSGEILVYGRDGTFNSILGRTGPGPGEFSPRITRVDVGETGRLYVADRGQRRLTVFSPDHELLDTVALPFAPLMDVWSLGDGKILVQGWHESDVRAEERQLYHLYSFERERLGSAGATWPGEVSRNFVPEVATRPIEGRFWTVRKRVYELEEYSLDGGGRLRRLVRSASWFPPDTSSQPDFRNPYLERPAPSVQAITTDGEGRLWVATRVADRSWEPGQHGTEASPVTPENADLDGIYDTMLEVIAPDRRTVVVRARLDPALRQLRTAEGGASGLYYSYGVDDVGVPVIDVWKARLEAEKEE